MLECGKNYRGTLTEKCLTCNQIDTEEHRLNECVKLIDRNFVTNDKKIPFDTIYSTNVNLIREIIPRINLVWNVHSGHGMYS